MDLDYDELCDFVDKRIRSALGEVQEGKVHESAQDLCPYWSDGKHCYKFVVIGPPWDEVVSDKRCRCGSTVKPKEPR